jgi:hypothetical protein
MCISLIIKFKITHKMKDAVPHDPAGQTRGKKIQPIAAGNIEIIAWDQKN